MKKAELIFVALLAGGLLVPAAMVGQWWLFSVFMVFFVCFGLVELLAVKITKKTVSQHFWKFSEGNKKGAWAVLIGMGVAWITLLVHLGAKLF